MVEVDLVELVVWRVSALVSGRTTNEYCGSWDLDVAEAGSLVEGDPELSPEKRVVDEAEVRDGDVGAIASLESVGRNPSVTMPSRARSCSRSPSSTDSLTDALIDLLRSTSPLLLSFDSMSGARAFYPKHRCMSRFRGDGYWRSPTLQWRGRTPHRVIDGR
jgi:hypothetical protein